MLGLQLVLKRKAYIVLFLHRIQFIHLIKIVLMDLWLRPVKICGFGDNNMPEAVYIKPKIIGLNIVNTVKPHESVHSPA